VDVIKLQVGLVYVFAGLAKINSEWLIDAMPLRIWMPANDTLPVIGPLMTISWMPWVFSWAGMLYDLTIPFWLLNRRTRPIAYAAVLGFHTITGMMFQIGVFPLVLTALTLVFFLPTQSLATSAADGKGLGHTSTGLRVVRYVVAAHLVLQVVLPFRYLLQSTDLLWDEEGYRFGWRVMLMEKAGTALFTVEDRATGRSGYVVNGMFLNAHQEKQMAMQPDMVLQYAHMLHDHYEERGMHDPIVRAQVWVTLNGRPSKLLVDPTVDLSREYLGMHRNTWVLAR
jgi:hypothetical protein